MGREMAGPATIGKYNTEGRGHAVRTRLGHALICSHWGILVADD